MWDESGKTVSGFGQSYTSLNESRSESFDYTIDNLLAYQNSFGGHTVDVLLGTSWTREYYRTMSVSSDNHDLGGPDITGYNGPGTVGVREMNSALLSFFTRINYDYRNRYLLSASILQRQVFQIRQREADRLFPVDFGRMELARRGLFQCTVGQPAENPGKLRSTGCELH